MERPRLHLLAGRISEVENKILETSLVEVTTENDSVGAISEPQGELWERIKQKKRICKI